MIEDRCKYKRLEINLDFFFPHKFVKISFLLEEKGSYKNKFVLQERRCSFLYPIFEKRLPRHLNFLRVTFKFIDEKPVVISLYHWYGRVPDRLEIG